MCQLILTRMSNIIDVSCKPRWKQSKGYNSTAVGGVCTLPRALKLAMITIRKSIVGFRFLSYISMWLRWRPSGQPEFRWYLKNDLLCTFGYYGFTRTWYKQRKCKTFPGKACKVVLSSKSVTYLLADWSNLIFNTHDDSSLFGVRICHFEMFAVEVRCVKFPSPRKANAYV